MAKLCKQEWESLQPGVYLVETPKKRYLVLSKAKLSHMGLEPGAKELMKEKDGHYFLKLDGREQEAMDNDPSLKPLVSMCLPSPIQIISRWSNFGTISP